MTVARHNLRFRRNMSTDEGAKGTVDRAFSLLRNFRPEDSAGVGVSELARRAQLSKSTTHRLLAAMTRNGAVQKVDDIYRLGPLFHEMYSATYSSESEVISEVLTPFLAALFERTRHTVHLGYLVGTDVSYANKLFSVRGVGAPSRIGGRVPGYCTGVGKAIMAYDESVITATIERGMHQWTPHTITDPAELRRVLAAVREEGLAYDREEIAEGLTCVAAPIFGQGPVPVAAMSVSGTAGEFQPAEHEEMLRRITRSASKAMAAALANHRVDR